MSRDDSDVREPWAAEGQEMIDAMRMGVIEALREHKLKNRSIITWDRDGRRIVEIPPDEIVIPEDSAVSSSPE